MALLSGPVLTQHVTLRRGTRDRGMQDRSRPAHTGQRACGAFKIRRRASMVHIGLGPAAKPSAGNGNFSLQRARAGHSALGRTLPFGRRRLLQTGQRGNPALAIAAFGPLWQSNDGPAPVSVRSARRQPRRRMAFRTHASRSPPSGPAPGDSGAEQRQPNRRRRGRGTVAAFGHDGAATVTPVP
jgi:hypothetical protein